MPNAAPYSALCLLSVDPDGSLSGKRIDEKWLVSLRGGPRLPSPPRANDSLCVPDVVRTGVSCVSFELALAR